MYDHMNKALLVLPFMLLAACGTDQQSNGIDEAASRTLRPSDAALAEVYDRSCRSCHTIAATGSPLTGDTAAWAPRMEKGIDVLLDNVVSGFGGMPPFGLCMDCDADQFEQLIYFMVEGK
jgi:cytochrome c5